MTSPQITPVAQNEKVCCACLKVLNDANCLRRNAREFCNQANNFTSRSLPESPESYESLEDEVNWKDLKDHHPSNQSVAERDHVISTGAIWSIAEEEEGYSNQPTLVIYTLNHERPCFTRQTKLTILICRRINRLKFPIAIALMCCHHRPRFQPIMKTMKTMASFSEFIFTVRKLIKSLKLL